MRQALGLISTAILAVVFASGCASVPSGAGPCASCVQGVTTVKKTSERHWFCVVNGKQVDCTKTPSECPECAKMMK